MFFLDLLFLFYFKYKHTVFDHVKNNKQRNKQNKQHKKVIPSQPNPFSERFFTSSLPVSILLSKPEQSMLWKNVIYSVPFVCKSNCFLWINQSNFFFYSFHFSNFSYEIVYIYELLFSGLVHIQLKQ